MIESRLKNYLIEFLPVLERNYNKSEKEWKNGEMPKAVFEYISQRYTVSKILLDRKDITGELFFDIYAPLTIDIRTGINLYCQEEQPVHELRLKEWLSCFDDIGFTDRQEIFNYPMKNLNNFDKKVKELKDKTGK